VVHCAILPLCPYARVNGPPRIPILVLGGLCLITSLRSAIGVFQEKEKIGAWGTTGVLYISHIPILKALLGYSSIRGASKI
jgi:hypothetical protein